VIFQCQQFDEAILVTSELSTGVIMKKRDHQGLVPSATAR